MKSAIPIVSFIATLIPYVYPHGWVGSITIAGKTYEGDSPGTSGAASVIRQVSTNSPVTSVSSSDLTCGQNALIAQDIASANPGDAIQVDWVSTEGPWFHNVGPMLTYLANCGEPCNQFDASQASWFKIQQSGRNSDGTWAQAQLNTGAPANLTLPSNLAPGNYLLRHEIIALQNAVSQGGAEFYPSCSQLSVGGSGSGAPSASDLVKLPGAYSATDPGILVDVYSNPNAAYTFPGPPIVSFVSGGGGGSGGTSSSSTSNPPGSSSASTISSPSATSGSTSPSPSTSGGACRLVLRRQNNFTSAPSSPNPVKRLHRVLRSFSHLF